MIYNRYLSRRLIFVVLAVTLMLWLPLQLQAQISQVLTVLVWSPDGSQIAGATNSGKLYTWDALTGQLLLELQGHDGAVYSLSWSPDNLRLASVSPHDGLIRIWDTTNGSLISELIGDRNSADAALVAWNPKGNMIVSVTANTDGGFPLRFWSVQNDKYDPLTMSAGVAAFDIAWSPDGSKLAVADYRAVYIFDDFSTDVLQPRSISPFRFAIAWSPDGNKLAAANLDGTVQILSAESGEIATNLGNASSDTQQRAASMSWEADGVQLIIDRFDGKTEIWDTTATQLIETIALKRDSGRFLMSLSPFGGRLALGNVAPITDDLAAQTESSVQTIADGTVQIIVPAPSLELLDTIAKQCNASPEVEQSLTANIASNQLQTLTSTVESLTAEQIPSGCAADLLAVAQALGAG